MSKLPIPNFRLTHDSPPIKSRKALSDKTEIVNSPTFSRKDLDIQKSGLAGPPKIEMQKTRSKLSISSKNFDDTKQRLRSISLAGADLGRSYKENPSKHKLNTIYDSSALQDPAAIRRQEQLQEKLAKLVEVNKDKLVELEKKIKDAKSKLADFTKKKEKWSKLSIELKSKISDSEVGLINLDRKIHNLRASLEKTKIHEEQMVTLRLKEIQNQHLRELDNFKAEFERELKNAKSFNDEDSLKEIAKLEEDLRQKNLVLASLLEVNEQKLSEERALLDEEVKEVIKEEEAKGKILTDEFEKANEQLSILNSSLEQLQSELESVKKETEGIDLEAENILKMKDDSKSVKGQLLKEIEELTRRNEELDGTLETVTKKSLIADQEHSIAVAKFDKEVKLRRRIQSSIEELSERLRVYVRVFSVNSNETFDSKFQHDSQNHLQTLTLNDKNYEFNKVFSTNNSEDEIGLEVAILSENNLKGANVSVLLVGHDDDSFVFHLLKLTIETLLQREDKYKLKNWTFQYSYQMFAITKNGVFDLVNGDKCEVKLENRTLESTSSITKDLNRLDNLHKIIIPSDSSTFIKIRIDATNGEKSFTSYTNLMNLSTIEVTDLIRHTVDKIKDKKFSSTEFASIPMYQLVHFLYSNTKSITLFNMSDDPKDIDENSKLLELASFVGSVDSVPVKRVYSVKQSQNNE